MLASLLWTLPIALCAQVPVEPRVDIGGGVHWAGAITFPVIASEQTRVGGGRRTVFRTETRLDASPGLDARVGVVIAPALQMEATASMAKTHLSTAIIDDVEGIPDRSVRAPVTQYLVEAGFLLRPYRWQHGRWSPFASAGAGYLRHVNDGNLLVENGRSYYVGGGAEYHLQGSSGRRAKGAGFRADLKARILRGGVSPDSDSRTVPVAGASLFVRF